MFVWCLAFLMQVSMAITSVSKDIGVLAFSNLFKMLVSQIDISGRFQTMIIYKYTEDQLYVLSSESCTFYATIQKANQNIKFENIVL